MCVKPSGHLAAFVSVLILDGGVEKVNAKIRGYHPRHKYVLIFNSRGVLVRVAPAGDVFDDDHQTAARAAAHPTDVG